MKTPPPQFKRIIVNRSATELASWLLAEADFDGAETLLIADEMSAHELKLSNDRIYRALRELEEIGAITFSRPDDQDLRTITLSTENWLWTAIRQGGAR